MSSIAGVSDVPVNRYASGLHSEQYRERVTRSQLSLDSDEKLLNTYRKLRDYFRWQCRLPLKDAERTVLTTLQYQHAARTCHRVNNPILRHPCMSVSISLLISIIVFCARRSDLDHQVRSTNDARPYKFLTARVQENKHVRLDNILWSQLDIKWSYHDLTKTSIFNMG